MKRQKADDGPIFLEMAPTVDVQWLPEATFKTILEFQSDDNLYLGVVDDESFGSEVLAEEVEDIDDIFAQERLRETAGGSFFSDTDRTAIAASIQQASKTVPTSGADFACLMRVVFEDLEGSRMAASNVLKEVERKKRFDRLPRRCQ